MPTPETEAFIAQHVRLFTTWRHVDYFSAEHMDPIDGEALMKGNCLHRANVLEARCKGAGIEVELLWCLMNGIPHAIVRHVESGLVSDHLLANPRTLDRRLDITDARPIGEMRAIIETYGEAPSGAA